MTSIVGVYLYTKLIMSPSLYLIFDEGIYITPSEIIQNVVHANTW